MPPVCSVRNQYRGLNAHLHSLWQAEGDWDSFHLLHIGDLTKTLNAKLLPLGYIANIQKSLQIRRSNEPAGKPESDVSVYDTDPERPVKSRAPIAGGALTLALPDLMTVEPELSPYRATAIYEHLPRQGAPGEPVAWVELLSPSNKPGGQDADYYWDKRLKLLESGIVFVELDYLHESPPTFDRLPRYSSARRRKQPEAGSHPYRIVVVDPRPRVIEGLGYPYEFDVDEPIPTVEIPLNAGDQLRFDFGVPYAKTFEEMLYGANLVDYRQPPLHFDRYSQADRQRILGRMLAVLKAVKDGVDVETNTPLPVKPVSLKEGLAQLQSWTNGG